MYSKVVLVVAACLAVCHGAGQSSAFVDNHNGGKFGYKVSHEYTPKEGSGRLHHAYDEGAQPVRGVPYYAGGDSPNYNGPESVGQNAGAYHHRQQHQQPLHHGGYHADAQQGRGAGEVAYYAKAPFDGSGVQSLPLGGGPAASYSNLGGNNGASGFRQY